MYFERSPTYTTPIQFLKSSTYTTPTSVYSSNASPPPPPPPSLPSSLQLNLDAATYSGTGPWIDSKNASECILYNAPEYSPTFGGGSFLFRPSNGQYAECPNSIPCIKWTVEIWHYYNGTNSGSDPCILSEIWSGTPINYTIGSLQGQALSVAYYGEGGWAKTSSDYNLTPNKWYHIVGTCDINHNLSLYVNNVLVASGLGTNNPASSTLGIHIMRRWDQNGQFDLWGGYLAVVRIYNEALTSQQIAQNYNTEKSRFIGTIVTTGLQVYLDANNIASYPGTGTVWYDLSGNANNVTMQNSENITYSSSDGGYFTLINTGYFYNGTTIKIPFQSSPYTLCAWVQLGSSWSTNGIISIGNTFGTAYTVNAFRTNLTNGLENYWWGDDYAVGISYHLRHNGLIVLHIGMGQIVVYG